MQERDLSKPGRTTCLPSPPPSLFSCHFTRVEFTPTIYADILRYRQPLNGINYNQNPPESLRINFLVTRSGEREGGKIKREPLRGSEIINSARITTSNVLTGNGGEGEKGPRYKLSDILKSTRLCSPFFPFSLFPFSFVAYARVPLDAGKRERWRWKKKRKGEKRKGRRAEGASESISADDTTPTPNYLKYTGDATFSDIYN